MDRKPNFNRYIVVDVDSFNKIQDGYVSQKHLSSDEQELLKIIKNVSTPMAHRLFLYRQLLFKNIKTRPSTSMSVQTDELPSERSISNIDLRNSVEKRSSSTQTRYVLKKNKSTDYEAQPTEDSSATTTEKAEQEAFFNEFEQDLNGFDVDMEKESFIRTIQEH